MNTSTRSCSPTANPYGEMYYLSQHLDSAGCGQAKKTDLIRAEKPIRPFAALPAFRLTGGATVFVGLSMAVSANCPVIQHRVMTAGEPIQRCRPLLLSAKKGTGDSEMPDPTADGPEDTEQNSPGDEPENQLASVINPRFPLDSQSTDDPAQARETA